MTCDEFLSAIDPYLDGELSVMPILRMHGHLIRCERCRRLLESEAALHSLLSADDAIQDQPRPSLREDILQRVRAEEVGTSDRRPGLRRFAVLSASLTGAAIVGLLFLVAIIPGSTRPTRPGPFAAELAAKHLLYSQGLGDPLEFRTSDPLRMAAWLERRIGSSLQLPRLTRADDHLVGGRMSSVADTAAAYLLYEVDGHSVSLFVTKLVPVAKLGAEERKVEGVELYTSVVDGVAVAWWEDEDAGRLYAAASTGGTTHALQFVLRCARSTRVSELRHQARAYPDPVSPWEGLHDPSATWPRSMTSSGDVYHDNGRMIHGLSGTHGAGPVREDSLRGHGRTRS